MLGLNGTLDQMAVENSALLCGHVLRRALDIEIEW